MRSIGTFEHYRKNNRLLDIGCGGGSFLEAAGAIIGKP
jgi:cyclopropane fatty-acyl-phospholipid synthase-like methyltransferase